MYRNVALMFLGLSLAGMVAWIVTRFVGPILGVSHEGFHVLTMTALGFVLAICLTQMAFETKK